MLTPIYEEKFSNNSYGFRPNRSCEMAVVKVLECFNDGYDWGVDIDLQSFFDEVNQDKLIGIIRRTIKDENLVSLIRKFLQSGVMESITTFITKKLGFIVNVEKSKIARPNEIKYLGFGFYKKINQNKWRPKPHIKSIKKFKTKLKDILVRSRSISLDERLLKLKQLIYGWINYFRIADMKTFLLQEIDPWIRRKLRVIIWKQWKKIRKRYISLRNLGYHIEMPM